MTKNLIGQEVATVTTDSRVVDIPVSILDVELARSTTSFVPVNSLREGLIKTLQYHGFNTSVFKDDEGI